jgi:transposase
MACAGRASQGRERLKINRVVHIMATVQLRNPTERRAYYDRRKSEGKTSMEALRALKRRLSNIVYKTTLDDAITHAAASSRTSPGGQRENDSHSSAAGSHPHTDSSDKPLPGPATTKPRTTLPAAS